MLLWAFIAAVGLAAAAFLCSVSTEVAESALLGSPGTEVILAAVFLVMVVGVAVAWPHGAVSRRVWQLTTLVLSMAVAVTTALAVGFFVDGEWAAVGILLLQSAIFIAAIAARVFRSSRDRTNRMGSVGA